MIRKVLAAAGERLVSLLSEHLAEVGILPQIPCSIGPIPGTMWNGRRTSLRLSLSAASSPPDPKALGERFGELVRLMLSRGHNLHDPRYLGHQVPASVPLAGLFDAVGSVTNQVMAIYEMGPWASAVEEVMVEQARPPDRLAAEILCRPDHARRFAGESHRAAHRPQRGARAIPGNKASLPGTSKPPVLVAHAEAHYCIARSAGILGLGTNQVIKAGLDDRRRIDPNQLDETLTKLRADGQPIVAVVACACATPVGAFDPLEDIAEVCRRHEVWMHVDAAHGGAALFSQQHRHLLQGLEQADSLIWDAHKMLFVPALCAFVFYKNAEHRFEAFRQDAPYLFDPSAPGLADFDSGLKTVECTKRSAAFGLWGVWSLFGPELFGDMVDVTFDLGRQLYRETERKPRTSSRCNEPQCNIVVFRHVPEALKHASPEEWGQFQLRLRRDVIQSGEFYIVPTTANGHGALRVTLINPLTTADTPGSAPRNPPHPRPETACEFLTRMIHSPQGGTARRVVRPGCPVFIARTGRERVAADQHTVF